MNWKERLLEAIVEGTVSIRTRRGEHIRTAQTGPVTLSGSGETRTAMLGTPQHRRDVAGATKHAISQGGVEVTTPTSRTSIESTPRGGRRFTKTKRTGTGPYQTKHSERKPPRLRIYDN